MEYCDMCDGTGLMEGWNRRDGNSCPKCKGEAILFNDPWITKAAERLAVIFDVACYEEDRIARSAPRIEAILKEEYKKSLVDD